MSSAVGVRIVSRMTPSVFEGLNRCHITAAAEVGVQASSLRAGGVGSGTSLQKDASAFTRAMHFGQAHSILDGLCRVVSWLLSAGASKNPSFLGLLLLFWGRFSEGKGGRDGLFRVASWGPVQESLCQTHLRVARSPSRCCRPVAAVRCCRGGGARPLLGQQGRIAPARQWAFCAEEP